MLTYRNTLILAKSLRNHRISQILITFPKMVPIIVKDDHTESRFDKEELREVLTLLLNGLNDKFIDLEEIISAVSSSLPDRINVSDYYGFVGEVIASRTVKHHDHSMLAGRLEAIQIQNKVSSSFSGNIERLYWNIMHRNNDRHNPLVSGKLYNTVKNHKQILDNAIVPERDLLLSYFGIKTLQKSYLININDDIAETPQYMLMRVALGIHDCDIPRVIETYNLMSEKYFIHASPTLFNAGTDYNYLSSCFLLAMEDDSIDGIFKTLHKTALISKCSGGIGLHTHNIRANGSLISSSNGRSSGLVPMLRVFNNTARYVDQGGNKRPGAFAIYLEPWHSDVLDVLELRKNHGKEELRARDLFYALWIPDLFMEKVKSNSDWCLFSPDECPGLSECYGEEFKQLYEKYERENKATVVIRAQKLWSLILNTQVETGNPYILFKDACNKKSNQSNLGTIKSSNLCCEIVQYSSPKETAVCNLASLALPSFIKETKTTIEFDLVKLHEVARVLTRNLNRVIDVTRYPVESAKESNFRHRPIAIGIQGLADTFALLRVPFDSNEAKELNIQIFETIYHAAIEESIVLSIEEEPYKSFEGSPASKGLLQFDLWNHKPSNMYKDWDELKTKVKTHGLRNSLLVAPMPTASTSQILGFNECFEPFTSNIYTRRVLSGEFQVVNKYLIDDLVDLGLWNKAMRDKILVANGSIQSIPEIPDDVKSLYKTVWEISQREVINMASDRGKFIDQLQSMNIHMVNPTFAKLTSSHFYAWEKGLKTGMYYLRTQAAARPIQFTVDRNNTSTSSNEDSNNNNSLIRKRYRKFETSLDPSDGVYKRSKMVTPESQGQTPSSEKDNIHDTTIKVCNIDEPEACDSCSG